MKRLATGAGFLLLLFCAPGFALAAQPRMVLPEPVHDFGTIAQGETVEHTFFVRNAGEAPLTVLKTKTSCGCTVAERTFDTLAPGEAGEIRVRFDSGRFKSHVRKTIYLYTNDPAQPVGRMTLTGRIRELIVYTPSRLVVSAKPSDKPLIYHVTLKNESDGTIVMTEVTSPSEALEASLSKRTMAPGESVVLEVSTVQGKTPPADSMTIDIFTDQEQLPKLQIPVTGVAGPQR